jgi:hypothetical protein
MAKHHNFCLFEPQMIELANISPLLRVEKISLLWVYQWEVGETSSVQLAFFPTRSGRIRCAFLSEPHEAGGYSPSPKRFC